MIVGYHHVQNLTMTELDAAARESLLDELIAFTRTDAAPFVSHLLVEPSDAYFQDTFEATSEGLQTVAEHLLRYVGLSGRAVDVALADDAMSDRAMLPDTMTDLAGVDAETVFLSCTHLGRSDDAIYSLAHEVARAALLVRAMQANDAPYRTGPTRGFVDADESVKERRRASIFAHYAGLGVLSVAGSHQYRQASRIQARVPVGEWKHVSYGALPPEETSFLLAVQLVVRAIEPERRARILERLPDERREEVLIEIARLERDPLLARLELPSPSTWAPEFEPPSKPIAPPAQKRAVSKTKKRKVSGEPVFRVRSSSSATGIAIGAIGALILTGILKAAVAPLADWSLAFSLALFIGAGVGLVIGNEHHWDNCSDCEKRIPPEAAECPGCAHVVGGRVASRSDRLDARERYEREKKREARRAEKT